MHESINESSEKLGSILAEFLKTKEFKLLSRGLTLEVLNSWAGEKRIKKSLATFFQKRVDGLLGSKTAEGPCLQDILEDPAFLVLLSEQIPLLVQGLLDILATFTEQLNAQSPDVKTGLFAEIGKNLGGAQSGRLFNAMIRVLQSLQMADKTLLPNLAESLLCGWIRNVDFAELRELLENAEEGFLKVVKAAHHTLWKYPAKLVILLSLLPAGFNTLLKTLTEIVSRFNQAPPDLIADILLSLGKDLDAGTITKALNEGFELIRKITTGCALVGDPGTSRLQDDISGLMVSVLKGLDGEVAHKARLALFRDRQKIKSQVSAAMFADSERLQGKVSYQTGIRNSLLQSLVFKLNLLEELPEEEFNQVLNITLSELDNQEISEAVELSLRLLEKVLEAQSLDLEGLIDQILQQLDLFSLQDIFGNFGNRLGDSLKPLGRAVVPKMVTGICNILAPADDEFEEAAAEARGALRSLLLAEEVQA